MRHIVAGLVGLLLAWPALADNKPQDKSKEKKQPTAIPATLVIGAGQESAQGNQTPAAAPDTPAGKYQALVNEYSEAQQKFFKEYRAAKTAAEKQKVLQEKRPNADQYAAKFMELAEKNPKDPAALDALIWVVTNGATSRNAKDSPRSKGIAMILRDHVTSPRLGRVCQALAYDFQDKDAEALLRGAIDKNPSAEVKGEACLALAQMLAQKASIVKDLKDENTAKQFERFFGKELVSELGKLDAAKLDAQSEEYFKTFAEKYLTQIKPTKLDLLVQRLANTGNKGGELVLRRVIDENGKEITPAIRGKACMALASILKQRAEALPDADAKEAEQLNKESEALCERVIAKFSDVHAGRGMLADQAKTQLYELRFLSKGKPAPEVAGEDLDGKQFKLSDYKGKVVLIDFWGNW